MKASLDEIRQKIDEIEAEIKRMGWWQDVPLEPDKYDFHAAFGLDKMAYSQWLQFIFIPRVKSLIESNGPFPRESHVGAQAVREFDGIDEAIDLTRMLSEFDSLIDG